MIQLLRGGDQNAYRSTSRPAGGPTKGRGGFQLSKRVVPLGPRLTIQTLGEWLGVAGRDHPEKTMARWLRAVDAVLQIERRATGDRLREATPRIGGWARGGPGTCRLGGPCGWQITQPLRVEGTDVSRAEV